jgi:hypothetical protein
MKRIGKEEAEWLWKEVEDVARLRVTDEGDGKGLELEMTNVNKENIIGPTFFYDDDDEAEEIEGEGIPHRVSRRRGRRHEGGGQME